MPMKKVSQSYIDKLVKAAIMVLADIVREAMRTNDKKALDGLQPFSAFMELNTAMNNGSAIVGYLVTKTLRDYNPKKTMPKIKVRKILDDFTGLSEHKVIEVLNGLERFGFVYYTFDPNLKNEEFRTLRHPDYTFVVLTDLWKKYLRNYLTKKRETDFFVENIGRIIWSSILANDGEKCGVRSLKVLIQILINVSSIGEISIDDIDKISASTGSGRTAQLFKRDESKNDHIKLIDWNDGKKVKINLNVLWVYNQYIVPRQQAILRKQGLQI
jgi:hypothetical protein